jgi:hypothetical protein
MNIYRRIIRSLWQAYCHEPEIDVNRKLRLSSGDEFMALAADHALRRAVRKRDRNGLTILDLRARVEDAARAANLETGRSISVSGGAARYLGGKTTYGSGQQPGRGLQKVY